MRQKRALSKKALYIRVALFFFLAVFLNIISYLIYKEGHLHFLEIFTAKGATLLINLSGLEARLQGKTIYITNAVWLVNTECTAIMIMLIFTSFILVYPASLIAKMIGLFTGIPFIFCANMVRLLIMAWIDKLKPTYSVYFHDYLWQVAFIVMVVFIWIVWIDRVVNREDKAIFSR